MASKFNAILFDLNETLVHQARTEKSHIACTYAALTQYYWKLTYEEFEEAWHAVHQGDAERFALGRELLLKRNLLGAKTNLQEPWYKENVRRMIAHLHLPSNNRIMNKVTWAFQDSWVGGLEMPPEYLKVMKQLHEDYELGLVTNFQQPDIIDDILGQFGLDRYLDLIVISAQEGYRKPHPDLFQLALSRLKTTHTPDKVVYVGDNYGDDVDGARLSGLTPILIDKSDRYKDREGQAIRIRSLLDLPQALKTLQS